MQQRRTSLLFYTYVEFLPQKMSTDVAIWYRDISLDLPRTSLPLSRRKNSWYLWIQSYCGGLHVPVDDQLVTGGDVAQFVQYRTGTLPTQVRFPGADRQGIFLQKSTFSADSSTVSVHNPCAIACIYICVHVKDPVVHVRVRWIMDKLKHPACTVGWVARLCRSWLSPGKAT